MYCPELIISLIDDDLIWPGLRLCRTDQMFRLTNWIGARNSRHHARGPTSCASCAMFCILLESLAVTTTRGVPSGIYFHSTHAISCLVPLMLLHSTTCYDVLCHNKSPQINGCSSNWLYCHPLPCPAPPRPSLLLSCFFFSSSLLAVVINQTALTSSWLATSCFLFVWRAVAVVFAAFTISDIKR